MGKNENSLDEYQKRKWIALKLQQKAKIICLQLKKKNNTIQPSIQKYINLELPLDIWYSLQ